MDADGDRKYDICVLVGPVGLTGFRRGDLRDTPSDKREHQPAEQNA